MRRVLPLIFLSSCTLLVEPLSGCGAEACSGAVSFEYTLVEVDQNFDLFPTSCADAGVARITLLLGNDEDQDAFLDDEEIVTAAEADCLTAGNGDQVLDAGESLEIDAEGLRPGSYDLLAFELVDGAGNALLNFVTLDAASVAVPSPRMSLPAALVVIEGETLTLLPPIDLPDREGIFEFSF